MMPFQSKAQMRKFAADPELRPKLHEWAAETPDISKLPEKVRKRPLNGGQKKPR